MPYADPEDQKTAARAHYQANKALYKKRARAHQIRLRAKARAVIHAAKEARCTDCRRKYPYYVMQFDHRPDEIKLFNIGNYSTSSVALPRLKAEIAKCDVVCANCHAERTHQRRGGGDGI